MELQRIKANDKTYGALAKAFERGRQWQRALDLSSLGDGVPAGAAVSALSESAPMAPLLANLEDRTRTSPALLGHAGSEKAPANLWIFEDFLGNCWRMGSWRRDWKLDVVNVLVQHGADVNWRPHKKKEPLLHSAARFGHVPVIKALLDSKAQLHRRLKGAGEAIHDAAHFGHLGALAELVEQRAQPFSKTSRGSTTPLDLAMEAGHQPVVGYLQELAARHSEL
ncbi:unnamed protein product [Cladocopium goreaui]|uniref:Uncharacterized protein n=1 Tax=Cladocopium goreaui TaxID=2562237 RepID=A0A9P1CNF9_9DINO|nr:unnamed protein product [Cladocopium goreaui]